MTVIGHIHQGVVVFDEAIVLPEGAAVEVRILERQSATPNSLLLSKYAGIVEDLPEDASESVDRVLYGAPHE